MEIPVINQHQHGKSCCFSPLPVYNLRIVGSAHEATDSFDNELEEHMHVHVYHRGIGKRYSTTRHHCYITL